ncbi:cytochrome P450 [Mycobacterium barrassiae]|uniref:cytochrome P450 n=1 Tax=Mycobacterium barrassiae TaxID=319709 RepID=UPI002265E805|nr:cytochrome P450 [Mycobacterium barrassiae]MCV7301515.1 cytochrome P450 [Mycobacterium barrassiae]
MRTSTLPVVTSAVRDVGLMVGQGAIRDLRRARVGSAAPSVPRTSYDPTTPETIRNPFPELARLREHPVHVNERLNVWMMARHEDVTAAARAHDVLSSSSGILLRSTVLPSVVTTDDPDHARLRRLAAPYFTPSAMRRLEASLAQFVDPAVDALASGEVVDMVPALTVPLPVSAIALLLGIDRSRWRDFRVWSNGVTALFGARSLGGVTLTIGQALPGMLSLRRLIVDELHRRNTEDFDDVLGGISKALAAGEMTPFEAVTAALLILVAGNETTTNLLGILLIKLATDPDLYARLRDNRDLIPAAVEEALRWGSPVQWVTRTTLAPYRVGDAVIPERSRVVLFYAGANRDPRRFDDPDRFDFERKPVGHTGFGHGAHFCLGAHLARLEVTVALNGLFDRIAGLELAGPVIWTTTPSLSGPTSLPVRACQG